MRLNSEAQGVPYGVDGYLFSFTSYIAVFVGPVAQSV